MTVQGTRTFAAINTFSCLQILRAKTSNAQGTVSLKELDSNISLNDAKNFLRKATDEEAEKIQAAGWEVLVGSVESGSSLWLPAGWMFYEQNGSDTVIGLKVGGVCAVGAQSVHDLAKDLVAFCGQDPEQGLGKWLASRAKHNCWKARDCDFEWARQGAVPPPRPPQPPATPTPPSPATPTPPTTAGVIHLYMFMWD